MIGEELLDRIQAINPETSERVTVEELAAVFSTIEERLRIEDETSVAPVRRRPRRWTWRGPAIAAAAALVIALLIAVPLLLTRGTGQPTTDTAATTTSVSPETIGRHPEELLPTGVRTLTVSRDYRYVVRDPSGAIWAGGGQLARLDPATGEIRVWSGADDAAFGQVDGLAPARAGGVWLISDDGYLRWFDGERFRDVVEVPPRGAEPDDVAAVVETANGGLLAATLEGGVFRWDGSSWQRIEGGRPVTGATSLAIATDGTIWVGNVAGLVQDARGTEAEWRWRSGGVSHLGGSGWTTFDGEDAAALDGRVLTIEPLSNGTVWVGTEAGLAHFDGDSWTDVDLSPTGLAGDIFASVGPGGTVWVATDSGLQGEGVASFNGTTWAVHSLDDVLPQGGARAHPLVTEDGVYVGTHDGLFHLAGDRWTQVLPAEEPVASPVPPTSTLLFAGVAGIEASADSLWVWGTDEVWSYTAGVWSQYPTLESSDPWDVTFVGDTLWAVDNSTVFSFDDGVWVELVEAPDDVWRIDGNADSGVLWLSTGRGHLYRWEGAAMSPVGQNDLGFVGDIVVTADGSVWAAGMNGYVPWLGGLARYDDAAGSWEMIRPLGGDDDIPAEAMATTPNGGLWVVLADWYEDWEAREAAGEPTAVRTLAFRDGGSGDWIVYDIGLTERWPWVLAAADDAVWLADGPGSPGGSMGIARFDGETWTHYDVAASAEDPIEDIAVAPDGTVWYVLHGVLYQLEI